VVTPPRRGASTLGCLFTLLILVTIGYFGVNVGKVYYRRYTFQDAMKQEARFASHRTDAEITSHLEALADSLGLPPGAKRVHIRRGERMIFIWSDYYETLELPGIAKDVELTAHVERAF
jgi:hypothetical protein